MLLKKGIDRLCKRAWVDARLLHNEFRGLISLVFLLPVLLLSFHIPEGKAKIQGEKQPDSDWTASDIAESFFPVLSDCGMTQHRVEEQWQESSQCAIQTPQVDRIFRTKEKQKACYADFWPGNKWVCMCVDKLVPHEINTWKQRWALNTPFLRGYDNVEVGFVIGLQAWVALRYWRPVCIVNECHSSLWVMLKCAWKEKEWKRTKCFYKMLVWCSMFHE